MSGGRGALLRLGAALLATSLSACALGPKYQRPELEAACLAQAQIEAAALVSIWIEAENICSHIPIILDEEKRVYALFAFQ